MTKQINHAWTAAALAICAIAGSAPAVADDGNGSPKCGPRTLDGSYVLAASGFAIPATGAQPKALIEQIDFDGAGHAISPHAANSMNGTIWTSTGGAANYYDLGDSTIPNRVRERTSASHLHGPGRRQGVDAPYSCAEQCSPSLPGDADKGMAA